MLSVGFPTNTPVVVPLLLPVVGFFLFSGGVTYFFFLRTSSFSEERAFGEIWRLRWILRPVDIPLSFASARFLSIERNERSPHVSARAVPLFSSVPAIHSFATDHGPKTAQKRHRIHPRPHSNALHHRGHFQHHQTQMHKDEHTDTYTHHRRHMFSAEGRKNSQKKRPTKQTLDTATCLWKDSFHPSRNPPFCVDVCPMFFTSAKPHETAAKVCCL